MKSQFLKESIIKVQQKMRKIVEVVIIENNKNRLTSFYKGCSKFCLLTCKHTSACRIKLCTSSNVARSYFSQRYIIGNLCDRYFVFKYDLFF